MGIIKKEIQTYLEVFRFQSPISLNSLRLSSSLGGSHQRKRRYYIESRRVTLITSDGGSTRGSSPGFCLLFSCTSGSRRSGRRNGKTSRIWRISAARTCWAASHSPDDIQTDQHTTESLARDIRGAQTP